MASLGGQPRHPAWYHNLCDAAANPEVLVRDKRRVFWAKTQVLAGEERTATWEELIRDRPFYGVYQSKTQRPIPLVRLIETRPHEA